MPEDETPSASGVLRGSPGASGPAQAHEPRLEPTVREPICLRKVLRLAVMDAGVSHDEREDKRENDGSGFDKSGIAMLPAMFRIWP